VRQGEQPWAVMTDDQHRAVLALAVVLLERHSGMPSRPPARMRVREVPARVLKRLAPGGEPAAASVP
jgi:hypothetical protein